MGARVISSPMRLAADVLFGLVAVVHAWFLVLERFLWEKPLGLKTFRQTREEARLTATLAKNQGLYNGFLAAGIVWALASGAAGRSACLFFASCVVVAGLYGAWSTGKRAILLLQALPAALALGLLLLA